MQAEILPVSLEHKQKDIENIREHIIPKLVSADYGSGKVLRILHRAATWYATPADTEHILLAEYYTAFYASDTVVPKTRDQVEKVLEEVRSDSDRFTSYGYYLKGNYRILGCFAPNTRLTQLLPETQEYFTGALPIQSKDYQNPDTPFYFPPVINIHKLLAIVNTQFNNRFPTAHSQREIATAVANYYFWGLVMLHPFLGGNHRAYDRFIEYAFAKKQSDIRTPLNETLNIPNDDPFNIAVYAERRRLLAQHGLGNQLFDLSTKNGTDNWLKYQNRLNDALFNCLNSDCAQVKQIADAILRWG